MAQMNEYIAKIVVLEDQRNSFLGQITQLQVLNKLYLDRINNLTEQLSNSLTGSKDDTNTKRVDNIETGELSS